MQERLLALRYYELDSPLPLLLFVLFYTSGFGFIMLRHRRYMRYGLARCGERLGKYD